MVQGRRQDPVELQLTSSEEFLLAELPSTSSVGPVLLSHTYGVLAKGDAEPFLLKYYAKAYPSTLPGDWRAVKDAERLRAGDCSARRGPEDRCSGTLEERTALGCDAGLHRPRT
jgi:hypothetical protein